MPVFKLEIRLVGQGQKLLQQPPAQRQNQAQQKIPADNEILAALNRKLDVGQGRGDQRNEKRDENADPETVEQKRDQLLLLQLLTANCLAFADDLEIPL